MSRKLNFCPKCGEEIEDGKCTHCDYVVSVLSGKVEEALNNFLQKQKLGNETIEGIKNLLIVGGGTKKSTASIVASLADIMSMLDNCDERIMELAEYLEEIENCCSGEDEEEFLLLCAYHQACGGECSIEEDEEQTITMEELTEKLKLISSVTEENALIPFDKDAINAIIKYSLEYDEAATDDEKKSCDIKDYIIDLVVGAAAVAEKLSAQTVSTEHVIYFNIAEKLKKKPAKK